MFSLPFCSPRPRPRALSLGALVCLLFASVPSLADDRDLYRTVKETTDPALFFLLDTSGSFNFKVSDEYWTSYEDGARWRAEGNVQTLLVPGGADDFRSRGYQAKKTIYEVLEDMDDDAMVGFAHFPNRKVSTSGFSHPLHWLYTAKESHTFFGSLEFPKKGEPLRFGSSVGGSLGSSCQQPFTHGEQNGLLALHYSAKLGGTGTQATIDYVNLGQHTYKVTFDPLTNGQYGDMDLTVTVRVAKCQGNGNPGPEQSAQIELVPYHQVDEDGDTIPGASPVIADDWQPVKELGRARSLGFAGPCGDGWEGNYTDGDLANPDSILNYATHEDPHDRGWAYSRGDVVSWDWKQHPILNNPADPASGVADGFQMAGRQEIMRRMAPNVFVPGMYELDANGDPIPDFRVGSYFLNEKDAQGRPKLKPEFEQFPPMAFDQSTPLKAMLKQFHNWYGGQDGGWKESACDPENGDPKFNCRERFVVLLTDGRPNCSGTDPEYWAKKIYDDYEVRVFSVGFGPAVEAGSLQRVADEGGTGQLDRNGDGVQDCAEFTWKDETTGEERDLCDNGGAILARNRQDLMDALRAIVDSTAAVDANITTGAAPGETADAGNSMFLSALKAVDGPRWMGGLQHFVKPLPTKDVVDATGTVVGREPDTSQVCQGDDDTSCFAWDAGAQLLDQAPSLDEALDMAQDLRDRYRYGDGEDERRIYYPGLSTGAVPQGLKWFEDTDADEDSLAYEYSFWDALQLPYQVGNTAEEGLAAEAARQTVVSAVARRILTLPSDPSDPTSDPEEVEYVLGDVFHSPPSLLGGALRYEYMSQRLYDNGEECTTTSGAFNDDATGYHCFAIKHQTRRKVLFAGANDGMIHAFDAGQFHGTVVDGELEHTYNLGTGGELFAIVPRVLMPRMAEMAKPGTKHEFSADGPIVLDDVFVDPQHTGAPSDNDREWRTYAVMGMREGARGYIALDVTQPDKLTVANDEDKTPVPDSLSTWVPNCSGNSYSAADCGPNEYPQVAWEFQDVDGQYLPRDEDGDGRPDLGYAWSKPNTGRVQLSDGTDRFVAIFGNGLHPDSDVYAPFGSGFIYMVDIETGKAIYKREVEGAVASEPAAVDTTGDGLLDTLYFGTLAGKLYKVDLDDSAHLEVDGSVGEERVRDDEWEPYVIFDAEGRSIYHPPQVLFVGGTGHWALAFGTGNREDIFATETVENRFYVVHDDGLDGSTVLTESSITGVGLNTPPTTDDLLTSVGGYYLELDPNERVSSGAFSLGGVMIFTTFLPDDPENAPELPELEDTHESCVTRHVGRSRIYVIAVQNGNPMSPSGPGGPGQGSSDRKRFKEIDGFAANPFADRGAPGSTEGTAEELTDELKELREQIMSTMPETCKFTNLNVNLNIVSSASGIELVAPIPTCISLNNWRPRS